MLRRIPFFAVVLGLVTAAAGGLCLAGEIVVVPLDLGGEEFLVSPNDRFEASFDAQAAWVEIADVQVRLVGSHTCQFAHCIPYPTYQVAPVDSRIRFGFRVGEDSIYPTTQNFPCVSEGEAVDLQLPLTSGSNPDWSFLADGTGTFFIEHADPDYQCDTYTVPSYYGIDITLIGVEIVVQMKECLGRDVSDWGAVKALYR